MAAVMEVKVPDIGDFKDVPVIEVMVKAGDRVKPEDSLVSLESDKATMDVPAPVAGLVNEVKVKDGRQGERRRAHPAARHRYRRSGGACRHCTEDLGRGAARRPRVRPRASPKCGCPTSAISRTCRSSRSWSSRVIR
jgi:pyruvate dehydrogenase E2 component (dihydrolipoamide acetyltransferase)